MRSSLIGTCRTYIHNQDVLAETMRFSSVTTIHAAALLLAQERRELDLEQMKKIREIFTEETSLFSAFRGSAQLVALALLSGVDDPRTAIQRAQEIYSLFKGFFYTNSYAPLACLLLVPYENQADLPEIMRVAREIYDRMDEVHPFLTGGNDVLPSLLLALRGRDPETVCAEIEECLSYLRTGRFSSEGEQGIAELLALSDESVRTKAARVLQLRSLLPDPFWRTSEMEKLPLALLAVLNMDPQEIARDVEDCADWLKGQRQYGLLGVNRSFRYFEASVLTAADWLGQEDTGSSFSSAVVTAIISVIQAQQAAAAAAAA